MKQRFRLGILLSHSGSYELLGQACRAGALAAVDAVNGDPARTVAFDVEERDPAGRIEGYAALCDEILTATPARNIVGCITS